MRLSATAEDTAKETAEETAEDTAKDTAEDILQLSFCSGLHPPHIADYLSDTNFR